MSIPDDLQYTKSHEWVRAEDGTVTIGITDHAQEELGDVVFVELPDVESPSGPATPSAPSRASRPSPTCTRR